ncbi:MAG: arsenic resistance protein [Proteobacteria bacterium]|nr:arsenic resistance protein [Pseudomonadota bacterium]
MPTAPAARRARRSRSNARQARKHQVWIYFGAVAFAVAIGIAVPGAIALEAGITPALALMLFVTFLQVPLAELGRALLRLRFLLALLMANFIAIPLVVFGLIRFLPSDPMIRLGVLMVLLTPCIDYVVTFSHLGRGNAKLLLAATPILLIAQIALLPIYLGIFLGDAATKLVHMGPFLHAFLWLIAIPLTLAAVVGFTAARSTAVKRVTDTLGVLPVPATALVLFVIVAAVVPQIGLALQGALMAVPIYVAFAATAPFIGWGIARMAGLDLQASRAIAFSAGTRNSLVVLPLAFAVPGAMPVLPAVIVAQTMVELVGELFYIKLIPLLSSKQSVT